MPSGQASSEYVALLALVAVILAAAAVRLDGAPGIPEAVVHHARVAICIAGGDICRSSDAEAHGLAPCVREGRERSTMWEGGALSILASRHGNAYAIEERSDGTVAVTAIDTRGLGVNPSLSAGRRSLEAGAEAMLERSERWTWVLPDEAAARAFLRRLPDPSVIESDRDWRFRELPEPTERYTAGGVAGDLSVSVALGAELRLLEAGARESIGRRAGPDGTTWVYDAEGVGVQLFGGVVPEVQLKRAFSSRLEVTEREGEVSRITVHTTIPGDRPDEQVRLRGHLDPSLPENAAVARDLLSPGPGSALRMRAAGRHLQRYGAIEREIHRVQTDRSGPNGAIRLPILSVARTGASLRRTLVAADVLRGGGWRSVRRDCLGFA